MPGLQVFACQMDEPMVKKDGFSQGSTYTRGPKGLLSIYSPFTLGKLKWDDTFRTALL